VKVFESFVAWLDAYVSREEPSSVLKALVGLMAFAGLLGTIFGSQAIRAGAFVVVIVFLLSTVLLLLADRQRLRRAYEKDRTLLTRYCDFLIESGTDPVISIETWAQKVYVQPNGDAREILTLKVVALRERVPFIRLVAGSRWDQPEKYRRDVKIHARTVTPNGPGPQLNVTTPGLSAQKIISIIHLHQPIRRAEAVYIEVTRIWPAKCLPLMRGGEPEDFCIQRSSLLEIQRIDYSVVLPSGFDVVYELIGAAEPDVQLTAKMERDQEDRRALVWHAQNVPPLRRVGVRIELK
jgi:hypothetical protein